jgi:hypothetical protein
MDRQRDRRELHAHHSKTSFGNTVFDAIILEAAECRSQLGSNMHDAGSSEVSLGRVQEDFVVWL